MVNKLRVQLKQRPYLTLGDEKNRRMWGEISICVELSDAKQLLLAVDWYVDTFIDWYIRGYDKIFTQQWQDIKPRESIAQAIEAYYDSIVDLDDGKFEEMREPILDFTDYHSLNVPLERLGGLIFVGKNQGLGEISHYQTGPTHPPEPGEVSDWFKPGKWAYTFDIADFQQHIKEEMIRFIHEWVREVVPEGKKGLWTYFLDALGRM